jgi:hypothetical protein
LTSEVSLSDFRTFVSALEGASVPITKDNLGGLSLLWEEFHFGALTARLSHFRESGDLQEDVTLTDLETRKRLSALEERMQRRDCEIAVLQTKLSRHSRVQKSRSEAVLGRVVRLEAEVSALVAASAFPHSTVPIQQSRRRSIAPSAPTSPLATPPPGSVPIASAPAPTVPASAAFIPSGWHSAIVPDFPELFEDFKEKQFALLWRGSRDGFGRGDFHSRCDEHPNTLTVILDTDGNIFGGFTPLKWDSRSKLNADPSLKSFLFTLKNPHNVMARRFALKAEKRQRAISCDSGGSPDFCDVGVSDNSDRNTDSCAGAFGLSYTNDTGLNGETFFTGSAYFKVSEIEVFEITD